VFEVQRLRVAEGGPVSYTVVDGSGLPVWPVDDYLCHLSAKRRSPNTVRGYAHDLADYFCWLEQSDREFARVTLEQLGEFFEWLRRPRRARQRDVFVLPSVESALETSTLVRKRAALAGFYRFHARRDPRIPALLGDPVGIRPTGGYVPMLVHTRRGRVDAQAYSPITLRPTRKRVMTLAVDEVVRLKASCRSARDRFLIVLLVESGLRVGEALGLRHRDLRPRAGEVLVVGRESNVNGARVKGLKDRTVPIGTAVLDAYGDYMESEYGLIDSDYVFVNLFRGVIGAPMTAESVKDLAARLRRDAGIGHFSPHVARHTYATRLLRAGVPIEVVAELLGHAHVQTTKDTYSHLEVEDHRRVLIAAGVLDGAVA